jgi:inosine/xanthosine triphosphate pyrophosphatase family protein
MPKPKLMTSNAKKLAEYQRLGLDADLGGVGPDLPEISASPVEVALRKAFMAGPGSLAEDTSLDVEGGDVGVNVRWLMDEVQSFQGRRAVFRVVLAHHDGAAVSAYEGAIHGTIGQGPACGFGFDSVFFPDGAGGQSLGQLDAQGRKDEFSARALAVKAYGAGQRALTRKACDFKPWDGAWQDEDAPTTRAPKL